MITTTNKQIRVSVAYTSTDETVRLNCTAYLDFNSKKVVQLVSGNITVNNTYNGMFNANQNAEGVLLFNYNDIPQGSSQNQENINAMIEEIEEYFAN